MKALLLAYVLQLHVGTTAWVGLLNAAFLVLYLQSALMTYRALRSVKRRPI